MINSLFHPMFAPFIRAIPAPEHTVTVNAEFWRSKFMKTGQLRLWADIFSGSPSLRISRDRLFSFHYGSPEQKCAEVLLWGYPSDMRGIVSRLLPHIDNLAQCAKSSEPWLKYYNSFPTNIGISTITKIAYFHTRNFDGLDALILDRRLINNTAKWQEVAMDRLTYSNARLRYPEYLELMHAAAKNPHLKCRPDQLELFLFLLGDSF